MRITPWLWVFPGDEGIVGDWNNKGYDTPGVYRPSSDTFYLSDQLCTNTCYLSVDFTFLYGVGGVPIANGWTSNGQVGVGLFNSGTFYLRNTVNTGIADNSFGFGQTQDIPLAGHWIADNTLVNPFLSPTATPPPTFTPGSGGGDRPAILITPTPPINSIVQPQGTRTPNSLGD